VIIGGSEKIISTIKNVNRGVRKEKGSCIPSKSCEKKKDRKGRGLTCKRCALPDLAVCFEKWKIEMTFPQPQVLFYLKNKRKKNTSFGVYDPQVNFLFRVFL